jgi:aspartate aminotransferase, mitochondrial
MGYYCFRVSNGILVCWLGLLLQAAVTAHSWTIPPNTVVPSRRFPAAAPFPIHLIRGGSGDDGDTHSLTSETTLSASVSSSETASSTTTTTTDIESSPQSPPRSVWSHVELGPPDAILGIAQAYAACTDVARKVNVCVGAYRDAYGRPWILPTVQTAEARLAQLQQEHPAQVNKEYLPIAGDAEFLKVALQFAYGSDMDLDRVAAVQTLSGTGACRIGGAFLGACWSPSVNEDGTATTTNIYIPVPTWGNHWKIFGAVPNLRPLPYRYYNRHTNRLDIDGLLDDLQQAPKRSIVVLHACAHNPTGCDPSHEQWRQIAAVLQERSHVAFIDSAYQGFASGDAERDAWAVRYLASLGTIPVLLAQSFAKNFGLYGERCGTLSVVCANATEKERIVSQMQGIIRPMYSSPPKHGSSIVKTILNDADLQAQYYTECATMAARIAHMRVRLVQELVAAGSVLDWSHVLEQIGMFAYTGMNSAMCDALTEQYAIFLTRDGRISLAGLTEDNLPYVAQAIHTVTHGQAIHAAPDSV